MLATTRFITFTLAASILIGPAGAVSFGQATPPGQLKSLEATQAQAPAPPPTAVPVAGATAAPGTTTAPATPVKPEEAEQLVASIALYPDSLLAQVLMASTYPLEVVQADRWLKQNPTLKDSPEALNKLTWDPSVKSLLDFPQALTMMSEKLDWTVKLGDAFIADQKGVMDAIQRLRTKAQAAGSLTSNNEVKVTVQAAPAEAVAGAPPAPQVIVVESASPSVVYVPTYNPTTVYGTWPYPSYPPYSYYPPGYVAGTALVSFGVGVAVGAAWGHAWGGCNWNSSEVDIDIDQNVNFNSNIDRDQYKAERDERQGNRQGNQDTRQENRSGNQDSRQGNRSGNQDARQGNRSGKTSFQHDPAHRQGVAYRDSATTEKFRGSEASRAASQSRDAYRGRAEAGRSELNTSAGREQANRAAGGSGTGVNSARSGGSDYSRGSGSGSASNSRTRDSTGTRSSGLSDAGAGSAARSSSSRGSSSRSSSGYSSSRSGSSSSAARSSAGSGRSSSGGMSRGGGGGSRGGGGRR